MFQRIVSVCVFPFREAKGRCALPPGYFFSFCARLPSAPPPSPNPLASCPVSLVSGVCVYCVWCPAGLARTPRRYRGSRTGWRWPTTAARRLGKPSSPSWVTILAPAKSAGDELVLHIICRLACCVTILFYHSFFIQVFVVVFLPSYIIWSYHINIRHFFHVISDVLRLIYEDPGG